MVLDVSEAIALAKDLLQTSADFRPHDHVLAEEFSNRAYEICDDLGIDYALIGAPDEARTNGGAVLDESDDGAVETISTVIDDDEAQQTSQQLRDLLHHQALALKNERQPEPKPKPERRFFRLFSRTAEDSAVQFQSA